MSKTRKKTWDNSFKNLSKNEIVRAGEREREREGENKKYIQKIQILMRGRTIAKDKRK